MTTDAAYKETWMRRCARFSRALLAATAVASVGALATGPSALALTGKPIQIGTPGRTDRPAVAVDAAGNGVIAWADTKAVNPAPQSIGYCVLAPGATACSHSGILRLGDTNTNNTSAVTGVQVLITGSTYVVLGLVTPTQTNGQPANALQEWQSTDGGATWTTVLNGGMSVSSAADSFANANAGSDPAVLLPGGANIGYGFDSATAPPTFSGFPLQPPPVCGSTLSASPTAPCPFATLQSSSDPNRVPNLSFHFASQQGGNAGVFGVFPYDSHPNGVSCGSDSLGYVYGSGDQGAANDYNVSPGRPNSAWRTPVAQFACGASITDPVVAGGPSGFGVLSWSRSSDYTVQYRAMSSNASGMSIASRIDVASDLAQFSSLSQDGAGGIYATWYGHNGLTLDYSGDGGAHWTGPQVLVAGSDAGGNEPRSAVGGSGQGWAAWLNQGQVYAQQFDKTDATPPAPTTTTTTTTTGPAPGSVPVTVSGTGQLTSTAVTITVTCAVAPCTITVTVAVNAGRGGHIARTKRVTLASGHFVVTRTGRRRLSLRLTAAGRRLLRHRRGAVSATVSVAQTAGGHTTYRSQAITLSKRR